MINTSNPTRPGVSLRAGNTQLITLVAVVLIAVISILLLTSRSPEHPSIPSDAAESEVENDRSERQPTANEPTAPDGPGAGSPDHAETPPQATLCPLVFEPELVDFGYVLIGTSHVKEVEVFNPSDGEITVTELLVSCRCTTAEIVPETIPPGASAKLMLTYTSDPYPHHSPRKSVRLRTREFPNNSPGIAFIAAVGREIRANADTSPVIRERSGTVRLESHDGEAFRVLLVDGQEPRFVDFDPQTDEPRSFYTVQYDFSDRADRSFPRYLHVLTDRQSDPMTEILTLAGPEARQPLAAEPAYWMAEHQLIPAGILSQDAPSVTREIRLLRTPPGIEGEDLSVTIRPATGRSTIGGQAGRSPDSPAAVDVRIVAMEPDPAKPRDRLVTLEFTLNPDTQPGLYHDIILLGESDDRYTELDVATYVTDKP